MSILQWAAFVYRVKRGKSPKTDSQSTWFQKLVADDPTLPQNLNYGTTPNGALPTDMYGFPIVYEPPAKPNEVRQFAVLRSVGKNGRDDKGQLDDWDIRYGPNPGYWYGPDWTGFYVRAGVCALLALIGGILLRWRARHLRWRARHLWWGVPLVALSVGSLALAIVPVVVPALGGESFPSTASASPMWTEAVASLLAFLVAIGISAGLAWFTPVAVRSRRQQRWREAGCCTECGYDLRGTVAAGGRQCPECGAAVPLDQRRAAAGGSVN